MTSSNLKLHKLLKERSNTFTKGCCIEQVKITSLSSPGLMYYSVSVESSRDNIVKFLTIPTDKGLTVYDYLNRHGHICGYPEFLLTI